MLSDKFELVSGGTVFDNRFVRDLVLDHNIRVATCLNGRFLRRVATLKCSQLRHQPCCGRAQREIFMSALGSQPTFAALGSKVGFAILGHFVT